jgi:hypothetical protein
MPIAKYRSVKEMPPVRFAPGDPRALEVLVALMELALWLLPPYPRGVFRYRGVDDPARPVNPLHRLAAGCSRTPPGDPPDAKGG